MPDTEGDLYAICHRGSALTRVLPTSNAKIRQLMKQGAKEIPEVAKKLGLKIITINVYGPDHEVLAVVEASGIEAVREFVTQTRLYPVEHDVNPCHLDHGGGSGQSGHPADDFLTRYGAYSDGRNSDILEYPEETRCRSSSTVAANAVASLKR